MALLLTLTSLFIMLVTLLPLCRHPHWVFRSAEFPRLQFASLALIMLPLQLTFLDLQAVLSWCLIAAVSCCFIWQLYWILPFTRLWPYDVLNAPIDVQDHQISIITANVLTSNHDSDALISLVQKKQPDVLITLESDQWWQDKLDVLEHEMPYTVKCPLDNLYGMHVYSRLPLENSVISYLIEDDVPSISTLLTLPCQHQVRMHFLHPAPPSPTENTESAERDAELIIVARSVAKTTCPTIVTGDLNDVAWSRTTRLFRKISGLLDPRIGRGMFNTFHANYPFLRWPLDHIFHSEHFTVTTIERLPSIGSDHFALFSTLTFNSDTHVKQKGLNMDQKSHRHAEHITQYKNASQKEVPEPEK
jgi:endonuclease/exonuclease/phosphatase (EEP) superfamily protein YafD